MSRGIFRTSQPGALRFFTNDQHTGTMLIQNALIPYLAHLTASQKKSEIQHTLYALLEATKPLVVDYLQSEVSAQQEKLNSSTESLLETVNQLKYYCKNLKAKNGGDTETIKTIIQVSNEVYDSVQKLVKPTEEHSAAAGPS